MERVHQTSHGLLDMEGMHDWVFSRTTKNGSGVCLFLGILLLMKVEMERRRGCEAAAPATVSDLEAQAPTILPPMSKTGTDVR